MRNSSARLYACQSSFYFHGLSSLGWLPCSGTCSGIRRPHCSCTGLLYGIVRKILYGIFRKKVLKAQLFTVLRFHATFRSQRSL